MSLELIKLDSSTLPSIADAIRAKTGETALLLPSQMPTAIASIPSGGGGGAKEPYIEETYDANGNLIDVNLVGYTTIRNNAFQNCVNLALNSLPSSITSIGNYAFDGCKNLALTSLPSSITSIGANAFYKCTGLASITFQGKPGSIASSAFNGCTNLKTINVPWASGEVANAPWGATNATINYNYTG